MTAESPSANTEVIPRRLDSLTGLRFVAAAGVLLDHTGSFFNRSIVFLPFGQAGVTFFFMLSGFVLTWSCRTMSIRTYVQRRIARIYPIYAASVAIGIVVGWQFHIYQTVWSTLRDLTLTQVWTPGGLSGGVDAPAWTLSVEAFFYVMFPMLVSVAVRLTRRQRYAVMLGLISLELIGWALLHAHPQFTMDYWLTNDFPVARLPEFVIGMLIALEIEDGLRLPLWVAGASLAAGGWWAYHADLHNGAVPLMLQAPLYVPSILLLAAVASADISGARTGLRGRPLVFLGQSSYSLYLLHFLVFYELWGVFGSFPAFLLHSQRWTDAAVCDAAILASVVGFIFIERPGERWLRALRLVAKPNDLHIDRHILSASDELFQEQREEVTSGSY